MCITSKKFAIPRISAENRKDLVSATKSIKDMLDSIEININISDRLTLLINGYIKEVNTKDKCVFIYEFSRIKSKKGKELSITEKLLTEAFRFNGYADLVEDTDWLEKVVPGLKDKVREKKKEFTNSIKRIKMLCKKYNIDFREYYYSYLE
jgi:hypothetical protein